MLSIDAIGRSNHLKLEKQILFLLADADKFALSGSRRFVNDVKYFNCANPYPSNQSASGLPGCLDPLYPTTLFESISWDRIDSVISMDQIGNADNDTLYLHTLTSQFSREEISDIFESIRGHLNVDDACTSLIHAINNVIDLPISPLTSFLSDSVDQRIKGLLLTGYDVNYDDRKYQITEHNSVISVNSIIK